jgi:SulP family sulfate permease
MENLADRPHVFRLRLLDALAGVGAGPTLGLVALPLAMAMAFVIASGVKPAAAIVTAIVTAIIAGFLVSALGGSKVQIGGPARAFIVIVYGIVERCGLADLLLIATMLAGVLLFAMGLLELGAPVRCVPVPITIGFTNGIAVLITLTQL